MVHYVVVLDFSTCEAVIGCYSGRYDPDTRQWLLKDFDEWFSDPGDSRAYVLLGDAGIGKTVMAAVISQRAKDSGNMAAAFFCLHCDGTRRDPRHLLGTVAYQLSNCSNEYDKRVGGVEGIHRMLANSNLGVHELFTKLLEEPLSHCKPCMRKLVVIDALDESEYSSRADFLDLIMDRFPFLPKWLVFFITSRPEDTVQYRLKNYNPCIKICVGNNDNTNLYQQHNLDIQTFLRNELDFSTLSRSLEELTNQCNGIFLYAFYIAKMLKTKTYLPDDIVPEDLSSFFRQNFERVHDKLGQDFYQKLFGCFVMTPSPLPRLFISFLLQKESSSVDEQEVIDAVSQFVAIRDTDDTFSFLHALIPDWLADEKLSRKLSLEKNEAEKYFRNIIAEYLNDFLQLESKNIFLSKAPLVNYMLCVGFRFLSKCAIKDSGCSKIVFICLTNYRFLQLRIKSNKLGIYSLIDDLKFSTQALRLDAASIAVLQDICDALRRDKIILVENHQLLQSCLCSSTSLVRNMVIPKNMSGAGFESTITVLLHLPVLRDIRCGAVSHDKKLFAVIQSPETLYLLNGSCQPIFGPVRLGMYGHISHLEFSPDDKFVFFGRLDRWFSVLEKRVVKMSQFSGKTLSYRWGSFICDGKYIAVNRQRAFLHSQIGSLLIRWAKYEIIQCPPKNVDLENLLTEFDPFQLSALDSDENNIRDSVICYYPEIFENQIWNVQTGTPVLKEMFVSQLGPFFYFWHMYCKMVMHPFELCEESMTLPHVALLNVWMFLARDSDVYHWRSDVFLEDHLYTRDFFFWKMFEKSRQENVTLTRLTDSINSLFCKPVPIDFLYSIAKIGGECYSFVSNGNEVFSKEGKWLVRRNHAGEIGLYEREDKNSSTNRSHLLTDAVKDCVFINDDKVLVYRTTSVNPNLYAINLVSQTKLRSISGTYPVYCSSGEGQDLGFIFSGNNESMTVLLRNLPLKFLRSVSVYSMTAKAITFTSPDLFYLLFSTGIVEYWQIADGSLVPLGRRWLPGRNLFQSETIGAKNFLFSHRGGSLVLDQGGSILFFNVQKSSVSTIKEGIKDSVACLTFSADDSLILFCIEEPDVDQCFYIWDVNTSTLSSPIHLDRSVGFEKRVDCCCFSSDNTKLFFCNAFSVLIVEHERHNVDFTTIQKLSIHSLKSDICSHCTVSCDDKLLACCIANEILIYSFDDPDRFYKVPHNHLGQVQYCKFLYGKRYLISYGIDRLLFLFDLVEWQSVAYLKHESCISMAISPDGNKIVCLESSGQMSVIGLRGLQSDLITNLELPLQANHVPPRACLVPSLVPEAEGDRYLNSWGLSDIIWKQ